LEGIIKDLINKAAAIAGARIVNLEWGPRGFAASLARAVKQGATVNQVLDVGAASGAWTLECMEVLPDARYIMVDPLVENEQALRAVADRHQNVAYWSGALGRAPGELTMNVHGDQSSFLPSQYAGSARKLRVETIDGLIRDGKFAQPDLIKADVQGFELEVLSGAEKTLPACELVLLETSFRQTYAGCPLAHEAIAFMGDRGFRIYDICTYLQRPCDKELFHSDILFARANSKLFEFEGYA
jgi:FkbM family methyltransferase